MAFLFVLWAISLTTATHQSGQIHRESEPEPFFVYTYGQSVQLVNFDTTRSATVGQQGSDGKPIAVDYDPSGGYLFIVDKNKMVITASNSTDTVVLVTGLYKPRGVAFDWINKTLYWTDQGIIRFCLLDFGASTFCRPATLAVGSLSSAHAIAVDPQRGQVYWTETGSNPRISRLVRSSSGSGKEVLLARKLIRPTGITVEDSTGHIYWVDLKIPAVGCIGCQPHQHVIVKLSNARYEPYSVAVFNGRVFFFNRKKQNTQRALYSLPTTKWTHLPDDCSAASCSAVVSPRPELLLGSADVTVFDFLIINATLLDSVTGYLNTTEATTVSTTPTNLSTKPVFNATSPSSPVFNTTLPTSPVFNTTLPSSPVFNAVLASSPASRASQNMEVSSTSRTKDTGSQNSTGVLATGVLEGHPDEPSSVQTGATQISPTNESEADSEFLLNIHPGLLAAAAVIISAIVLTIILVIIVWRKRRSKKGNINNGFSSLDRPSPTNSLYDGTSSGVSKPKPTAQVSPLFAGIIPSTGIYDSVPNDLNNSTCTGGTTPSFRSQDLPKQQSYLAMIMKDPANLTNPNYETVIEIDQVNKGETNGTILLAMVPKHHYANLFDPQSADYSEVASIGNQNASKSTMSVYDSPANLSSKSTTSKSTTSKSATSKSTMTQSSQSGTSNSNTSRYGTTFHLEEPQKPQCAQTI